ncbi:hypothetical protein [Rhodanobacter aciditrophus]|uniref:hypothetical protein n=1 Tax=Rhodanobacter aciditrophus TaxID=1623218 RepID=UPI003CF2A1B6
MRVTVRPLLATALACTLAACSMPDTTMENGAIKLYGDVVTLHVDGAPQADIASDGGFVIDGKAVAITPAERDLLAQYNRSVRAVRETGMAMGTAGIETAAKAIAAKASSTPGKADEAAKTGASKMQDLTRDICKDTAAIKVAQDQLAAQLAAFKPYAGIVGNDDAADCAKGLKG